MSDKRMHLVQYSPGQIIGRTLDLLRQNAVRAIIAMAAMTVPAVAIDLGWGGLGAQFLLSVISLVMQYWLTASLLDDLGLRSTSGPRFPAFFLLGIVTGLGILLGMILLIIPGILLFVRWSISVPAVVAGDERVFDAIGFSWRETESHFWPILAAFLVIYGAAAAGAAAGYVLELQAFAEVGATILELSVSLGLIAGWHAAVAIYVESRRESRYSEVFA
jgi:hypothetical protein